MNDCPNCTKHGMDILSCQNSLCPMKNKIIAKDNPNLKISCPVKTGELYYQFDNGKPQKLIDVFNNEFKLTLLQTEESDRIHRENKPGVTHSRIEILQGNKKFSLFIKPV